MQVKQAHKSVNLSMPRDHHTAFVAAAAAAGKSLSEWMCAGAMLLLPEWELRKLSIRNSRGRPLKLE